MLLLLILQVNNTHNISYGGNNTVTNVAYSKYSQEQPGPSTSTQSGTKTSSSPKSYENRSGTSVKDQDVVVLLPQRKTRTPRIKNKLSVS